MFDIAAARKDGVPDSQIADYLASQAGFDVQSARNDGTSDSEIADYLSQKSASKSSALSTTEPMSSTEDVARTVASVPERGVASYLMTLPNLLNTAAAGPQLLGRGIAEGADKLIGIDPQPRGELFQPFLSSEEVLQMLPESLQPHQPQTIAGKAVDIAGQTAVAMLADKGVRTVTQPKVKTPLPEEIKSLDVLPEAAKAAKGAPKVNPIESGIKANKAISKQYETDTTLQRTNYADLNQKGKVFGIETPQLYSKADNLIAYLKDKVTVGSSEHRALTDLEEIVGGLKTKYSTGSQQSSAEPMYSSPAQGPKGIEPSDLVDIKTVLNSGLKPNKFSTAGSAKIIEFKNYVNQALKDAGKASPEFGKALKVAEKQAAKVGAYKEDSLRQLWQPEDYLAYRTGGELPADTLNRASKFHESLNIKGAGKVTTLSKILPKPIAREILKDSIRFNKQSTSTVGKALGQLVTKRPFSAARTGAEAMMATENMPITDLAKYIQQMQMQRLYPTKIQPPPNFYSNQPLAAGLGNLFNVLNLGDQP